MKNLIKSTAAAALLVGSMATAANADPSNTPGGFYYSEEITGGYSVTAQYLYVGLDGYGAIQWNGYTYRVYDADRHADTEYFTGEDSLSDAVDRYNELAGIFVPPASCAITWVESECDANYVEDSEAEEAEDAPVPLVAITKVTINDDGTATTKVDLVPLNEIPVVNQ